MEIFESILLNSILPIFLLISLGFVMGKKFRLDANTLTKINLYLFVPAFLFVNVFTTEISADLLRVALLTLALLAVNFALGKGFARFLRLPARTGKAFENALMFYNSGNIGISLVALVFSNAPFVVNGATPYLNIALSVQIMTLLIQNLTTNTIGLVNSGGEGVTFIKSLAHALKLPTLYVILCAVLFRFLPFDFAATPFWPALNYLRGGLVSVALITLGAQLAETRLDIRMRAPYFAAFLRLIGGPAAALLLIKLFGFAGVMAQAILISASTPVAVNTALLALECGGDVDFSVQTVTLSTLFSAVTMTAVVYLAYILF